MINQNTFPSTLIPDSFETHIIDGIEINIPIVHLEFKKWDGEPIANTFGGKGLIDYKGKPMFAELAIQCTALEAGWNARWVETYAMKNKVPYYFTEWSDGGLTTQLQEPITDKAQIDILELIAENNNKSYSGCWDVLVWNGRRTIFIEAKRIKKDRFRMTQDRWLSAALHAGLPSEDFMIVWWDFSD